VPGKGNLSPWVDAECPQPTDNRYPQGVPVDGPPLIVGERDSGSVKVAPYMPPFFAFPEPLAS